MKRILLLIVFACTAGFLFSQPYNIGHREIAWVDSSRDNRNIKFEVYYPSAITGESVPVIDNEKKFPLVVFGHGYQLTYTDYLWLKDSLVPKGFFLVFPRTEEVLFPSHTDFAKDFAFLIDMFSATRRNKNNWYYNKIKNSYAVAGHSMGGGCSLLSVQYSSKITAVFNFAAAETNPSAIAACSAITIPSLLFAGGKDCISPPSSNQLPMYNNMQPVCKTYIQITAARHCQWSNNNGVCRAGELFCSPISPSPKTTLSTTFTLLYPWLNDKLNSKQSAPGQFQQLLSSTTGITYQQNCNAGFVADNNKNINNNLLRVFPSVITSGATVNVSLPTLHNKTMLQVYNQSGKLALTKSITDLTAKTAELVTTGFQKGIYFIVVADADVQYKTSFMVE